MAGGGPQANKQKVKPLQGKHSSDSLIDHFFKFNYCILCSMLSSSVGSNGLDTNRYLISTLEYK